MKLPKKIYVSYDRESDIDPKTKCHTVLFAGEDIEGEHNQEVGEYQLVRQGKVDVPKLGVIWDKK